MKKNLLLVLFFLSHFLYSQQDCESALNLCGNSNVNYSPIGYGNTNEYLGGCMSNTQEHNSVWYKIQIATSGTLTFVITPNAPADYDWSIYGPNLSCANKGNPIRCNAAGTYGTTGLNFTSTNTSSAGGSLVPFCKYLDVIAGETYYIMIDNWVGNGFSQISPFSLTWGGTATITDPFASSITAPHPFVAPGTTNIDPTLPNEIPICTPTLNYNFTSLSAGILNNNTNFTVTYHTTANDALTGINPLPSPYLVNAFSTYYYSIAYNDPTNPGNTSTCRQTGMFKFKYEILQAQISAPTPVLCPGGNIVLTSNQPTGNIWSTGATTQSITVTTPGTYSLTYNNGVCTSLPTSVSIIQDTNPNVQITGNLTICDSPTQLTASATGIGNTYSWSTGATTSSISVTTAGTYTVTVKTPGNCLYQKTVTVVQGTIPTVNNSSLSVCTNATTAQFNLNSAQNNLSTTAGVTFDFYANQADALAGNTNTIANPNNYTSGNAIIYVRVKSAACFKIAELQLIVNPKPNPTITSSALLICNNSPVTLTSSLPTGNTWSTGATTQSIIVTTPGTYTLTNNNGICTSDIVSTTLAGGVDPNTQISGNLSFCEGGSTTLTASTVSTGNTFTWSNGATGNTITVSAGGVYTVTTTTPSGCQFQNSVTVTMDPPIVVTINTPLEINCTNTQVTLNASSSTYPAGSTFLWTASAGGNIVSGATTLTPIVNTAGTYTLKITSSSPLGCNKQASVTVTKNITPPTITVTAPNLSICSGDSITLTASGATTYTWTGMPGNGNTQIVSPTTTTTYTVTGIGANGCPATSSSTITITVVPKITTTLPNILICKGETAILDAGASPNYTYIWSTGATTQTISTGIAGTYSVIINNGACSKTLNVIVSYIVTPEITDIVYDNKTLTIKVKHIPNQNLEYSIDGGITWQTSNIFTNVFKNTDYPIKVRNRGELCETSLDYYTFFMANVITPNSDGINDVIDFSELKRFGDYEGSLFDKYGKSIFKISNKTPIWDGKYLGRSLPTDSYWYKLLWHDKVTKKPVEISGWILLKNRD
ncbi:MAG: T9SS type B sorting domain-containing protein [Chryseobacterium sp.]|nr:T9SS type B sorting domain-containing protein [Candidatus Chryseobacterium enterohippi]